MPRRNAAGVYVVFFVTMYVFLQIVEQQNWKLFDTSPPYSEYNVSDCDDVDFQPTASSEPQLFTQSELNYLV
jgi:hypothetical protein